MPRPITTALELGWSLWAYEARIEFRKDNFVIDQAPAPLDGRSEWMR
jgi:hypothetical protein